MKPRFGPPQHLYSLEIHREADPTRQGARALQLFAPLLLPPLWPEALRRYDPLDVMLQPLVLNNTACAASIQLPASLLFPPRSARCLARRHRKRCAPSREGSPRQPAKAQNADASTTRSKPRPSVPLLQDDAQSGRETRQAIVPRLTREDRSALSPRRSLRPW